MALYPSRVRSNEVLGVMLPAFQLSFRHVVLRQLAGSVLHQLKQEIAKTMNQPVKHCMQVAIVRLFEMKPLIELHVWNPNASVEHFESIGSVVHLFLV